jgi:hypothetical protein
MLAELSRNNYRWTFVFVHLRVTQIKSGYDLKPSTHQFNSSETWGEELLIRNIFSFD